MLVGAYGTAITVDQGGPLWLGPAGRRRGRRPPRFALRAPHPAAPRRLPRHRDDRGRRGDPHPRRARPSEDSLTGGVFGIQRFADDFFDINPYPEGRYGSGSFAVHRTRACGS